MLHETNFNPISATREDAISHYMNAMKGDPTCIGNAALLLWRGSSLLIGMDGRFRAGRSVYNLDDRTAFLVAHDAKFVEEIENISKVAASVLGFAKFIRNE